MPVLESLSKFQNLFWNVAENGDLEGRHVPDWSDIEVYPQVHNIRILPRHSLGLIKLVLIFAVLKFSRLVTLLNSK